MRAAAITDLRHGVAAPGSGVSGGGLDMPLLTAALALLGTGLVMVGSASVSVAAHATGEPLYYFWRQAGHAAAGLALGALVLRVPLAAWERAGRWLVPAAVVLLVLVLVPGLGQAVNGSRRWLALGPVNLQASEPARLLAIVYLAGYLVRHGEAVRSEAAGFLRPMVLLLVLVFLLLLEPDYGAAAVLLATAAGMMWLGGARPSQFMLLLAGLGLGLVGLAWLEPYRMERLTAFLDPWSDPYGAGFQLTQALIAFGRGEWFGVGLGASVQKLFYLPEAHTDFVFAVLAEELGLAGVLAVLGGYAFLLLRMVMVGHRAAVAGRPFAAHLAWGLALWLGLQAFINMGVNMGVLPTKGLTLPLMSYGGSSLVVTCVSLALVLRAGLESTPAGRRRRS